MKYVWATIAAGIGIGGYILMGTLGNGWVSAFAVLMMLQANNLTRDIFKK